MWIQHVFYALQIENIFNYNITSPSSLTCDKIKIVVRFKGPAAQKTFLLSHGEEYDENDSKKFAAYETLRSIFALTNQNSAPPVTTDSESIWLFEKIDNDNIRARLRIASYLNAQSDSLYFDAKNRAVAFADYSILMKRSE